MRKFWLGFVIGIVVLFIAGFIYVRFGFIDPRADIEVGHFERGLAMDERASQPGCPLVVWQSNPPQVSASSIRRRFCNKAGSRQADKGTDTAVDRSNTGTVRRDGDHKVRAGDGGSVHRD